MSIFNIFVIIGLFAIISCGSKESDQKKSTPQNPGAATDANKEAQNKGESSSSTINETSKKPVDTVEKSSDNAAPDWTSKSGITALLDGKAYEKWWSEDEVHSSSGPHGKVRTFINDVLFDSLKDGNKSHPKGSIAVKELYNSSGTKITGYATEVKISEGNSGDDWLWYENLGLADGRVEFYGAGNPSCTGCHSQGIDFVTTNVD